ncbi:hypothetical protein Tco_0105075 [Tanacetum coccineum]
MQALKDNIKHQQLSMDVFPPLCVIKNVKMIEDARESSQTKRNTDEVNQRDKNKGRNRKNLRCIISIEPEHVYDEMIDAKADMDVIDDEETNTDAENIPQSQLKQSLFDALLKDPKLRERDKALFEVLSKGEDVLKPGKDTCRMDDLRKRSYGDPDHDYHKGENARSRNY